MISTEELREEAQAIAFWLNPENASARRELEQRNPPLGQWLSMVQKKVEEKLEEREAQEVRTKA